jgi:uncharacterized cupredoxin-like copper-binding protein
MLVVGWRNGGNGVLCQILNYWLKMIIMRSTIDYFIFWCCCLILAVGIYGCPLPALAIPAVVATPIELKISLGNTTNQLKFFPDRVQLVAGKKYNLLLSNPSPQKHYFTAREFASSSWTQKVDAGNVEIKGVIQELELRPNTTAAWVLVPMKPGSYQLRCTIPGHTEAGMTGTIVVATK